jgi:hypothetical protein
MATKRRKEVGKSAFKHLGGIVFKRKEERPFQEEDKFL